MAQLTKLSALVAFALLAVITTPGAEAHALQARNNGHHAVAARVEHVGLARRQDGKPKKKCPNRAGTKASNLISKTSTSTEAPSTPTPKPDPPKPDPKPEPPKEEPKPPPPPPPKPKPQVPARSSKTGLIYVGNIQGAFRKSVQATGGKIFGTYNWGVTKYPEVAETGIPFIPTLWGEKTIPQWDVVKRGYATMAFGCNEVNQADQSTMSVSRGVQIWKQYMSPLINQGYTLFSHSVSNAPSGLDWLDDFRNQCKSCWDETAAVNLHYYSNSAQGLIDYLTQAHNRLGKDIVVSEFGCVDFSGRNQQCNVQDVQEFIRVTTSWMDKTPWIKAYWYFGAFAASNPSGGVPSANALFTESGGLTAVGNTYLF